MDLIDRWDAIEALGEEPMVWLDLPSEIAERNQWRSDVAAIKAVPSAQHDRDLPLKPIETHDKAWAIPSRQAVCPKCDYYLGHIAFLDDYKGKRITYCEVCGQAIDWEGWKFNTEEGDAQ